MDNFNLKRGERLVLEGGYFSTPCILCATASICSREQKKSVREGAFWPFSGLCVWGNIHQESTLVWWYRCSESGDKCEVWADCSQVNGEFWTNWRIGEEESKGTHFFPSSKLEVSLSPFLCAATGWLSSCFLEPPSLGRVTIFITHHWREEAWARPHC